MSPSESGGLGSGDPANSPIAGPGGNRSWLLNEKLGGVRGALVLFAAYILNEFLTALLMVTPVAALGMVSYLLIRRFALPALGVWLVILSVRKAIRNRSPKTVVGSTIGVLAIVATVAYDLTFDGPFAMFLLLMRH